MRRSSRYLRETQAAIVGPTTSQLGMIEQLSTKLGITIPKVRTEAEARFLIDDLIDQERYKKRHAK